MWHLGKKKEKNTKETPPQKTQKSDPLRDGETKTLGRGTRNAGASTARDRLALADTQYIRTYKHKHNKTCTQDASAHK